MEMKPIAHIESDFKEKFGIPRQSGLVEELRARVVFEPEYRVREAFRGLEGFSRIWLLWEFSGNRGKPWSPTVRPPRLGGNVRMGVFATRSPFRPNPIGLSCVGLEQVETDGPEGPVLHVTGADLLDGTPIYDVKPYLPYADAFPEASAGFTAGGWKTLQVELPPALAQKLSPEQAAALTGVLRNDPRPSYQDDPGRVYGMAFGDWNLRFTVEDGVLRVRELSPRGN